MFRLNTWFRFKDNFYGLGTTVKPLKKVVDSGILGWPLKVTISGVTGFNWKFYWVGKTNLEPKPVPAELDYDMWLGPAPYKPYNPHRVHSTFRGYWDYDGGGLGDMGQHYIDPVQYIPMPTVVRLSSMEKIKTLMFLISRDQKERSTVDSNLIFQTS
jgi:hypothetical protein